MLCSARQNEKERKREREREKERDRESIPLFCPIPWLRCVLQHAASVCSPSSHHRQQKNKKNIALRVSWLFSLLLNLVRVLLGKLRKAGTTSGSCLWRSGTRRLSDLSAGSDWPRAGVRLMFFVVHTKSESPGDFQILWPQVALVSQSEGVGVRHTIGRRHDPVHELGHDAS